MNHIKSINGLMKYLRQKHQLQIGGTKDKRFYNFFEKKIKIFFYILHIIILYIIIYLRIAVEVFGRHLGVVDTILSTTLSFDLIEK